MEILQEYYSKFHKDGTVNTSEIKSNFQEIQKSNISNGDTYLILTDNIMWYAEECLEHCEWEDIEIWKFFKVESNKLLVIEYSNKNKNRRMFNQLKATVESGNVILPEFEALKTLEKFRFSSNSIGSYYIYKYFIVDSNDIDTVLYRFSTNVYGCKLPSTFEMSSMAP